jgi:hypothetical protein
MTAFAGNQPEAKSLYQKTASKAKPATSRKPLLIVDRTGSVRFRTKLVRDFNIATHFARCISKNSRFLDPEVVTSDKCKGSGWFVTYLPSNPERRADMITRLQAERIERCLAEKDAYRWTRERNPDYALCRSTTGNEYRVSANSCTCPDWQETCSWINIHCKHQLAHFIRFDPFAEDDAPSAPARALATANCDF